MAELVNPEPPGANGVISQPLARSINPEEVLNHLTNLLEITLGATTRDLQAAGSLLSEAKKTETILRCQRFAAESQTVLYVQKDLLNVEKVNGTNGHIEPTSQYVFSLSSEPSSSDRTAASIALIKRAQPIDPHIPISSQIQVINLPGLATLNNAENTTISPFEILHSIVHLAIAPYFEAYTKGKEPKSDDKTRYESDSRTGVPGAKKKIAELELSLRHLQQNIAIPELSLTMHPVVNESLKTAAMKGVKPSIDLIPSELLLDSRFLNDVQNHVNGWIKSIQAITKLERDPETGTAEEEINFWLSMENAVDNISKQLNGDGVILTLDILRNGKRFQATTSFSADTGLKDASDKIQRYNQLMRDFPLDQLLAATSLQKVITALDNIFNHLNKKLRITSYPVARALSLVSAISGDLEARMLSLLHGRTLMHRDYRDFQTLMDTVETVWKTWDENLKDFTNAARESVRRRNERFIPIKINPRHVKTQERLSYMRTFRTNHEQLQRTIVNVLRPQAQNNVLADENVSTAVFVEEMGDVDAVEEVAQAYNSLKDVDVLDTSPEGTQIWVQAEMAYNERTARVENSIIARLRDRLAVAKTANEMFRVFSKFNALFVRPKIRGAISEYQTQLIDSVKQDISLLHERFKLQYGRSEAHAMAQLRDLPSVSGAIIWARQIERQLDIYLKKVEDVLGKDWNLHSEGSKLAEEGANFRTKLDTQPIFHSWVADVNKRKFSLAGRLFGITRNRSLGNVLELTVTFDPQIVALFKEVRNLLWLNFTVPHAVGNISKDAKKVYPYAVSLTESIRILGQTSRVIDEMGQTAILLAGSQNTVQDLVLKGLPLRWETFVSSFEQQLSALQRHASGGTGESKHVQFVKDFSVAISVLQDKTDLLRNIDERIRSAIADLKSCDYDSSKLKTQLAVVQNAVDQLNLENYSNLQVFVRTLNSEIEAILLQRLLAALQLWTKTFQTFDGDQSDRTLKRQQNGEAQADLPQFSTVTHEISMRNQVIYLDPPSQFARAAWLSNFHSWIGIVLRLPAIRASRYELKLASQTAPLNASFQHLTRQCVAELSSVYNALDQRIDDINLYVDKWLRFQSLWDLQVDHVIDILGSDLNAWLDLLLEIRKARSTFDTTEAHRSFGNVVIDYDQVQSKVNQKYDQWQQDVLQKFANRLGERMREVYADLGRSRRDLEGQALETSSTAQAVSLITSVQQCKRKVIIWETEIDTFKKGESTLNRNRYMIPQDWLYVDQVTHEWDILNDILARKLKIVEDQADALTAKILAEDKIVQDRITEISNQWTEDKPSSGTLAPETATATLTAYQTRLTNLKSEADLVAKAKSALELEHKSDETLDRILEEVNDFSVVWASLSTIWQSINELRDALWANVQPRKLRQSLDGLIKLTKDMPSRMRQYAAFEHVQNVLRQLLKANAIITDLKTEAMRERHWIKIFKALKPNKRYSQISLTLGDIWDLQPSSTESVIRDFLSQAQGEMALEEFLRQVRDTWQNYTLDLVNYQNKCRLIRGWDDLFAKCSEHLNSLQAMKHSPYYKEFEEDASSWEDKLNRVHVLFDVWIDVQRQWVYLEGVFTGNAEITHLLPLESSRFQNINMEFFTILKKVNKSPYILDVLNIAGVQKSLERLADLLNKIQKALGEYLEKERMSFPRFYFVGDEDLLEMIGNSNDTLRIAKHFRKMFAGLSGLLMDDEESTITGFTSKEGEEVLLKNQISLIKIPKINDWLAALESNMRSTLADLLDEAIKHFKPIFTADVIDTAAFIEYINAYPAQIVVLATQVVWTSAVEESLQNGGASLQSLYDVEVRLLESLAQTVLGDLNFLVRKKCEHLITACVHQRDVISRLLNGSASSPTHYLWLIQMRYVYIDNGENIARLQVRMANAALLYGFEYLGVPERLVRTPLTDRCFLTLTQAMSQRLGGSPYGPAGTGKTESVKALGVELGRFTLVFCCDDTFDFQAMGRIFIGICQVGAWGCFDEFNRLEERILSAVSQQVQNIQLGLKRGHSDPTAQTELVGRQFKVNPNTGLFITMNPGYAGRSNLPDNLKKLFRSVAMSKPDKELIAEVMLYSQGFKHAKTMSKQTVPFFDRCLSRLTKQAHYDFGLRALKSVLVSSGSLKRTRLATGNEDVADSNLEAQILVQSIRETIAPKLVKEDVETLKMIEAESFPNVSYIPANLEKLSAAIKSEAAANHFVVSDSWMTKILQLFQIQTIHHGVMMVGSSGSGKSAVWKVLLRALQQVEGVEGVFHIIDSKVMTKEALYGHLDSTTREWTDGLFTSILRKIVDNLRGEDSKRHWIVFDGDVDPEWVENLNSVLDDNKLLTLPNGERLSLPPNVRIMFEVETLKYATLATVSRCGMVWFNDDTVSPSMILSHYLENLATAAFNELDEDTAAPGQAAIQALVVQKQVAAFLQDHLASTDLLQKTLDRASNYHHIMEFTIIRALHTMFSLLNKGCRSMIDYNIQHEDFPLEEQQVHSYLSKKLLLALTWSFTGDCPLGERKLFGDYVAGLVTFDIPSLVNNASLIDYDVVLPNGEWKDWQSQVPHIEVNTHSVTQTDVVIPTLDTVRHEDVLYSWLAEHKPLLLCGPPGSGKTMTLFSALRKLPNMEVVGLNFSSATTPDLIIKTFDQYCEYRKTLNGVVMSPTQLGRWLVVFCDEINLPAPDKYGTQRAISFLRQLVEQNGFWRTSDKVWVTLERIQFVGACNPPTDVGRTPLGARFLRHAPLIMVDYPGELSLQQIYGTFNDAVLKIISSLRGHADALTKAMVQLYLESQARFTPQIQPHYVYSPRELTRWVRGVYEAIRPLETLSLEGLIRIWAHEALRLFQDRLVNEEERRWTEEATHRIALQHFPGIDERAALGGPILFSNWLSKNYVPVEREQLREFVKARLKTFCEEEVDVPLILFNDVLEHVLRIDRVFRQPQGHLILIGVSGSGKTTLSRFVAWMNGLKTFQIKVHGKYSSEDFDNDLREVLRRTGCKGEQICFIMDESNVLDSGFLERMNTLLANAEVPGLFEGDEYAALMTACKEGASRQGLLLDSQEELYKWFTQQIVKNLHVVFTMNPPEDGLSSKAATSPALFNRCVLNWFGDWSDQALFQVGSELTQSVDLDKAGYNAPSSMPIAYSDISLPASHRDAVVNSMVHVHHSIARFNTKLAKQQGRTTYLTPRHFLDFVAQYVKLFNEKREDLEEQQRHLNVGLEKLKETVDDVSNLRASLAQKKTQLERKDAEANEKLKRMLANQQEAEASKSTSLKIRAELDLQEAEVAKRKKVVEADLAKAEPAVQEAQDSVSNIKKQHLTEVRSMGNPPGGVKLALESVCALLGHKADSWKAIQGVVRRDDFISSIVNYNNEKMMTRPLRIKMENEFLAKEDFTFDRVNRASKACGPLVQWVQAQVNFSSILDRVGPLREEAEQLEEDALHTKAQAQAIEQAIAVLEKNIETYKVEYAALIAETNRITEEMKQVESKVHRSVKLLESLSSERTRWEEGSKNFETQIGTIVGDVLVASAFIAYSGLYDQQFRKAMIEDWIEQLSGSAISFKQHNSLTDFLSDADEQVLWQNHGLPADELCTENAIILKRFNRYPLIIDPSGRASEFLKNENKDRRLTITSFLDDNFTKQLESSLRFGNPILIQDAEHLDPVLNHVLNKEYQKTGGRILIQLGKQEIDFSPAFKLYLSTRDPSAIFPPDICSRTTFVNFTVTQSSLQTQSLNDVLKSERPDVDERRTNLFKMQGQFTVQLRGLERQLLQALNASEGNILENDVVINSLETLKTKANDISQKMAETEGVMTELEAITSEYSSIAQACSAVFSILEQLSHLNHFYQFSLQYFVDIFNTVLHDNPNLKQETGHQKRGKIILRDLFLNTFKRTSASLLQKDRVTFAILLARAAPYRMDKDCLEIILDGKVKGWDISTNPDLKEDATSKALRTPMLKDWLSKITDSDWQKFTNEESAENAIPAIWGQDTTLLDRHIRSLLLVKFFRVDRFVPAAEKFVNVVFGKDFLQGTSSLDSVVKQVDSNIPIALCSSPGFDASYKVDNLVSREQAQCANIAMGSAEGITAADKAINNAAANGSWVLVKNVHLTPSWLQGLEKQLESAKPHPDFRLFLSMETSPKIPVNLLRASRILMFEQPAGIRANMKDSLTSLSSRADDKPVEKGRLYLLLSFMHAIIQERLRYAPTLGWKGFWEFNDADYECSAYIIDTWIESAASGRSNLAPNKIPWDLIRSLIVESIYGGKVDDEGDLKQLQDIVEKVLQPGAYEEDHKLVESADTEDGHGLTVPNGTSMAGYLQWVDELPEREPPTYLGLPANAEKILLVGQGQGMIKDLSKVREILDEGEHLMAEASV